MAQTDRIKLFFNIIPLGEVKMIPRDCVIVPGFFSANQKNLYYPATKGIEGYKILEFKSKGHARAFFDLLTTSEQKEINVKADDKFNFILNKIYSQGSITEVILNPKYSDVQQVRKLLIIEISEYIKEFFFKYVKFNEQNPKSDVRLVPYMKASLGVSSESDITPVAPVLVTDVKIITSPESEQNQLREAYLNQKKNTVLSGTIKMDESITYGLQSFYLINKLTLRALKDMKAVSGKVTETKSTSLKNYHDKLTQFVTIMKATTPLWVKFASILEKLETNFSQQINNPSITIKLSTEKYSFILSKLKSLPNQLKDSGNEDKFLMTFLSAFLAPYFDLIEERSQVLVAVNKMYVDFYRQFVSVRGNIKFIEDPNNFFYKRMEKIIKGFK